jgi:hypothetical protein
MNVFELVGDDGIVVIARAGERLRSSRIGRCSVDLQAGIASFHFEERRGETVDGQMPLNVWCKGCYSRLWGMFLMSTW